MSELLGQTRGVETGRMNVEAPATFRTLLMVDALGVGSGEACAGLGIPWGQNLTGRLRTGLLP